MHIQVVCMVICQNSIQKHCVILSLCSDPQPGANFVKFDTLVDSGLAFPANIRLG
jgi:hypothetical protein